MQTANYYVAPSAQEIEQRVLGLANQLGYHGGIAGAGAKLLAKYFVDLNTRVLALEETVNLLEAQITVLKADKVLAATTPAALRKRA